MRFFLSSHILVSGRFWPEWFKNELFWKETYNFLFPEKIFIDSEEQIENVLKLIDHDVTSVLDFCCGPGRCSTVLAKKGFSVTGVDLSPYLLDKAKERAKFERSMRVVP